jgi:hypothetical protein
VDRNRRERYIFRYTSTGNSFDPLDAIDRRGYLVCRVGKHILPAFRLEVDNDHTVYGAAGWLTRDEVETNEQEWGFLLHENGPFTKVGWPVL